MDNVVQAQPMGDFDGPVARDVIDEDDPLHEGMRDVGVRPLQRPRRVVGGHDHDDAAASGDR